MRSPTGGGAAVFMLLAFPLAVAAQVLGPGAPEIVIHLALAAGSFLLAVAVSDFGLPRWLVWVGRVSAGLLGGIFLLQGLALSTGNETLDRVAFDVLGQQIEGVLPDVVLVWFLGLLLLGSHGWTRIVGFAAMAVVVSLEVARYLGPIVGVQVPIVRAAFLLPFLWLLLESVTGRRGEATGPSARRKDVAEGPVA
jgi:hypothetical protein